MNYSVTIWTVAAYVESNIKQNLSLDHLVKITGFSLPYLREVYKERMGTSLSRYILERKIYNSAADLLYSPENATQIALNYGFTAYDTFTRAFKRILGLTPSEFKRRSFYWQDDTGCWNCRHRKCWKRGKADAKRYESSEYGRQRGIVWSTESRVWSL